MKFFVIAGIMLINFAVPYIESLCNCDYNSTKINDICTDKALDNTQPTVNLFLLKTNHEKKE
ncbi:hypothetical protein [Flavobacterium sp. HSC-61S13]|uniref:hypothetical protein n=1 Tax=Flavobacterium sp. HSC-61S13 TaxID=2910963 RepID=UPI00209F9D03|nr:hypothetical protein [Flavobacterium sp. HSC-61S13]MCP1997068.1 hypothetical protein [Flavobacterium sp. HSC-61S13]